MSYILGINFVYHDSSACLIKDGKLVVAIEEERLSRVKYAKLPYIENTNQLPFASIEHCLKVAGIEAKDLAAIGTSFVPGIRYPAMVGVDRSMEGYLWSESGEKRFEELLLTVPGLIAAHFKVPELVDRFHWLPHHVTHAASAYLVSPYDDSAIITFDGMGEDVATWIGHGVGTDMRVLSQVRLPHSIGLLWGKICEFVGFNQFDAAKVMGLGSFGNPEVFKEEFKKLIWLEGPSGFSTNLDIIRSELEDYEPFEKLFGTPKISSPTELRVVHEDIAAALQAATNVVFLHLAKYAKAETGSENLCLAGGVAMNCVANSEVLKSGLFKSIYIQPAANDAGTALGAAFYLWNSVQGNPRTFVMTSSYTSCGFSDEAVESVLKEQKVQYELVDNVEFRTAELLAEGNIVGWFQGQMEWGPRALGNRSLLVDPRNAEMKEILNIRIKRREPFRPFAPSVLEEDASDWFNIPTHSVSSAADFMILTFDANKEKAHKIPAVVHVDGTSRIQVVRKETNAKYHKLISEFKKLTGVPMVLNTSFNDNEPIVCSPSDAVRTFQRTRMDYLVIHNFICQNSSK